MEKPKTFAVIDIETTGGSAKFEKITEIAIVLFRQGKIVHSYTSLVHPERSIPPFISRITGITNEMVADAPKFYEIAKDIIELLKDCIFVAHNVRFDYTFIQEEYRRLGYSFRMKKLCTLALSRKLIPGLKSYSLKNLSAHFGIKLVRHHRAPNDAKATAALLDILIKINGSDALISDFVQDAIHTSRLPMHIPKEKMMTLPETAGVYYFENKDGEVIYVGKSKNIKKRVLQHFVKMTRKAELLQHKSYGIHYKSTGSELIAMLLESIEIKRLQPELNKSQKLLSLPHKIVCHRNKEGYLVLRIVMSKTVSQDHEYIKSFRSNQAARQYLAWINREYRLCEALNAASANGTACFLHNIRICKGACIGAEAAEDYNRRVWKFIDSRPHFDRRDFVIVDEGRTEDEKAIIAIVDGQYYGYGYLQKDHLLMAFDDIISQVKTQHANDEVHSMIWHYLQKKKRLKIIEP